MIRFFRIFAIVLGLIGVLACLVGIGLSWTVGAGKLNQMGATIAEVEESITPLDERMNLLQANLNGLKDDIAQIEKTAQSVAQGGADSDPAQRAKIEAISAKLAGKLERAKDVVSVLYSVTRVLHRGSSFISSGEDSSAKEDLQTLEEVLKTTLDELNKLYRTFNASSKTAGSGQKKGEVIAKIASEIGTPLSALTAKIARIGELISLVRSDVHQLKETITFWQTYGPPLATLVLVWIALGQALLLRWGWKAFGGAGESA